MTLDGWTVVIDLGNSRAEARHLASGTFAEIALTHDAQLGWVIIGANFVASGGRLNNRHVRGFSFAGLEQMIIDGQDLPVASVIDDLPEGQKGQGFYEAVAKQFLAFKAMGEDNPLACMVHKSGRPKKTVQGWVTKARKMGLLPAGRPGRAG